MTDETLKRANCKCKYCSSNKSQTEISRDLGLTSSGGAVRIPYGGDPNRPKLRPIARGRKQPGTPCSTERVADLRANRRFRCGELVWTALNPSIEGEDKHERIEFWPALINDFSLKIDVDSRFEKEAWTVKQYHTYSVRLLGVPVTDLLPEQSLLPYQACGPSNELIERLRETGKPKLLENQDNFAESCPIPLGTTKFMDKQQLRFNDAVTPFAFAIQIAAHLVQFWTPAQEYAFHGEVPSTSSLATKAADGKSVVELKESRCQGLWWGAERIWIDELVRLQPSRAQVFSGGSNLIHPPSPRADGRGVLMRINSILSLPGETRDSPRICKVSGVLYELAEESYEEPSQPSQPIELIPPIEPTSTPSGSSHSPVIVTPFQGEKPRLADPFEQGSNPPSLAHMPPYPLPEPPPGFKFRPIVKSGYEIVLDVAFIAGRYYPGLLNHLLLKDVLDDPSTNELQIRQLSSLVSLVAGAVNSMECIEWTSTRAKMIQSANYTARQDLLKHWHRELPTTEAEHREDLTEPSLLHMNVDHP